MDFARMNFPRILLCLMFVSCSNQAQFHASAVSTDDASTKAEQVVDRSLAAQAVAKKTAIDPGAVTAIDIGQLFVAMQASSVLLVDCRPPIFYHMGHIDSAISWPLKKFDKVIGTQKLELQSALKAGKVVVLYCQNIKCPDAHIMAEKLSALGYAVSVYKGGWEEWKQAGLQ